MGGTGQLAALDGEDRLKLLREFVRDWALLRHGGQTAERLRIEREWLALEERACLDRFKRKTIAGWRRFMPTPSTIQRAWRHSTRSRKNSATRSTRANELPPRSDREKFDPT